MAVSVPERLGLRWLALISEPKATFPGGQLSLAPPCKYPNGWRCLVSIAILITTLSGSNPTCSMPRSLFSPSSSSKESKSIWSIPVLPYSLRTPTSRSLPVCRRFKAMEDEVAARVSRGRARAREPTRRPGSGDYMRKGDLVKVWFVGHGELLRLAHVDGD